MKDDPEAPSDLEHRRRRILDLPLLHVDEVDNLPGSTHPHFTRLEFSGQEAHPAAVTSAEDVLELLATLMSWYARESRRGRPWHTSAGRGKIVPVPHG